MNSGTDKCEDEASDAENEEAGEECDNTDGAQGGVEFYGKVEKSREQ